MTSSTWPNLYLAGAMKAGTSALYEVLHRHPDIYIPRVKEPNYFADDKFRKKYKPENIEQIKVKFEKHSMLHSCVIATEDDYLALYATNNEKKYLGDASTSYLPSLNAAQKIFSKRQDARILVILRDPAQRAWSHYLMDLAIGRISMDFHSAIQKEINGTTIGSDFGYLNTGLYYKQLQRYLDIFGSNVVHIIIHDDLIRQPEAVLDNLSKFLGIGPFDAGLLKHRFNPGFMPRLTVGNLILQRTGMKSLVRKLLPERILEFGKSIYYKPGDERKIPESALKRLREFYADDIRNTSRLISRDLSHWLSD